MKNLILLTAVLFTTNAFAEDMIPLASELPKPLMVGTPVPINVPNLEAKLKKRPDFQVPVGTVNLAKGKKVTTSSGDPIVGTIDLITDGDKEGDEGSWVELDANKQWVQIDLEKTANISAIIVWHFHSQERAYRDVIVQVSDDAKFEKDVTTVFDNSAAGKDRPYVNQFAKILFDIGTIFAGGGVVEDGRHVLLELRVIGDLQIGRAHV